MAGRKKPSSRRSTESARGGKCPRRMLDLPPEEGFETSVRWGSQREGRCMVDTTDRTTAVGDFDDRSHAHYAVEELQRAGFTAEQIGVVVPDEGSIEVPPLPPGTKAGEGA